MQAKGICPVCASPVPRVWFIKRKFRPCLRCARPIKANDAQDTLFSVIIGLVVGLPAISLCILIGALVFGYAGAWLGLVVGCVLASLIAALAAFWLFPYFVSFEPQG